MAAPSLPEHKYFFEFRKSYLCTAVLIGLFYIMIATTYGIYYQTNDDVAMSMIASGYGAAGTSDIRLFSQGCARGALAALVPNFLGFDRYFLFTMLCLLLSVIVSTIAAVSRLGDRFIFLPLTVFVIFSLTLVEPQFTITAAVLYVAGLAVLFNSNFSAWRLAISFSFFVMAVATRIESVLMCAILSLPFLALTQLGPATPIKFTAIAMTVLAAAAATSATLDRACYAHPEWAAFQDFNEAKTPLLDFKGFRTASRVLEQPNEHGLSQNDLRLAARWWHVDNNIANDTLFRRLWDDIKKYHIRPESFDIIKNGRLALDHLTQHRTVLALIFVIGMSLLLHMRPQLIATGLTLALLSAAIILFNIMGRGMPPRVLDAAFIPVMFLCLVSAGSQSRCGGALGTAIATAVVLATMHYAIQESHKKRQKSDLLRTDVHSVLRTVPEGTPHVVWGRAVPAQLFWPATMRHKKSDAFRYYWLSWAQLTPPFKSRISGGPNQLIEQFRTEQGLSLFLIDPNKHLPLLETYCLERFSGAFHSELTGTYPEFSHAKVRCSQI